MVMEWNGVAVFSFVRFILYVLFTIRTAAWIRYPPGVRRRFRFDRFDSIRSLCIIQVVVSFDRQTCSYNFSFLE